MSDKQKRLINNIRNLAPRAEHRHCARNQTTIGERNGEETNFKCLFWEVVNSCNESQYAYKLNRLKAESVQAYDDFMSKCPQTFCKSLISFTSKSDMIENNIRETFNSYILKSRDKSLIEMLEAIRSHLMMRIWNASHQLSANNDLLCKNVMKKLEKLKKLAKTCQVTCEACYEHVLQPISGVRSWLVVNALPILPPPFIKNPGRPKECRKRDAYELRKQSATKLARIGAPIACKNCHEIGHNRRTCKNETRAEPSTSNQPTRRRRDNNQRNRRREGAQAPQDVGARSVDLRALLLARQGYGVVFSESGNALARTPGGRRVQIFVN